MGGQNHQPTSNTRLIAPSAWLSQKLGEGFIAVLQANNQLENAIIVAMKQLHVKDVAPALAGSAVEFLDVTIAELEVSEAKILEIDAAYDNLLVAAAREGYTGNPLAPSVDALGLRRAFAGKLLLPDINERAWNDVEARLKKLNVLATLKWEREQFERLTDPTRELIAVVRECRHIAGTIGSDRFVEAIEHNELPLRQHYARVFSMWNHLHAMFLYSALMTTELFYRASGYRSLLHPASMHEAATEAIEAR